MNEVLMVVLIGLVFVGWLVVERLVKEHQADRHELARGLAQLPQLQARGFTTLSLRLHQHHDGEQLLADFCRELARLGWSFNAQPIQVDGRLKWQFNLYSLEEGTHE